MIAQKMPRENEADSADSAGDDVDAPFLEGRGCRLAKRGRAPPLFPACGSPVGNCSGRLEEGLSPPQSDRPRSSDSRWPASTSILRHCVEPNSSEIARKRPSTSARSTSSMGSSRICSRRSATISIWSKWRRWVTAACRSSTRLSKAEASMPRIAQRSIKPRDLSSKSCNLLPQPLIIAALARIDGKRLSILREFARCCYADDARPIAPQPFREDFPQS